MDKSIILKASHFAELVHSDHVRKYTNEPYFNHLYEVAEMVHSVGGDANMVAAAFLHDSVEDGKTTLAVVKKIFGDDVANLVDELTDVSKPEDGNREARKAKDLAHTASGSARAHTVKLADLISNTKSITKYAPRFAEVYMVEKRKLLDVLVDGDATLYVKAKSIVDDYYGMTV